LFLWPKAYNNEQIGHRLESMIKLRKIHHRGKDRLGLFFKYDSALISEVKEEDDILNPGLPIEVSYFIEEKAPELMGLRRHANNTISTDTLAKLKTKVANWQ